MIDPQVIWASSKLPTLPSVAIRLLELSRHAETQIQDVVDVIRRDPAISAKLLKAANSSYFGVRSEIRSVDRAVSLLGTTVATSLALSFTLSDQAMSRGPMVPHYRSYWMQSVVQAIAAEALCRQVADENPSEYFLCGLLVDIGRLAMLKTIPNEYRGVLETAREEQRPLVEVEREQLGIDHVDVSIRLMENWKLAESLVEAVRSHHLPADELQTHRASPHFALLKAIGIAAAVGDYFCATAKGEALQRLRGLTTQLHEFTEPELDSLLDQVSRRVEETGHLFAIDSESLGNPVELMAQANEQLAQLALREHIAGTQATLRQQVVEQEKRELEERHLELQQRAVHDSLTKVYNRQFFDESLEKEANRSARQGTAIGVIFCDVDHFKKFNDTYGHQFGDAVLKQVAACLGQTLRNSDVLARYGGEEFVILVHQPTEKGIERLAERLRQRVEAEPIYFGQTRVTLTASFGAAIALPRRTDESLGPCLVAAADEALYEAKHHGRNQIRLRILIGDQDRRLRQLAMQRRFSRWLVQHELLDIPTVSRALLQCPADHVRIGELAQRQRILDDEQVRQILHDQRQNGERFGEVGLRLGLLTEEQLTYLLALQQENPRALAIAIARLGLLNPQAVTESLERYLKETVPQPETVPG